MNYSTEELLLAAAVLAEAKDRRQKARAVHDHNLRNDPRAADRAAAMNEWERANPPESFVPHALAAIKRVAHQIRAAQDQ